MIRYFAQLKSGEWKPCSKVAYDKLLLQKNIRLLKVGSPSYRIVEDAVWVNVMIGEYLVYAIWKDAKGMYKKRIREWCEKRDLKLEDLIHER